MKEKNDGEQWCFNQYDMKSETEMFEYFSPNVSLVLRTLVETEFESVISSSTTEDKTR